MFGRSLPLHSRAAGSITTLFEFEFAALVLLNFDDNNTLSFLRVGEFVMRLIIQSTKDILVTTCRVLDFDWPIAKDSPVIRLGMRSFAFVMPGLVFGLQFAPLCSEDTIDTLERVFMRFSDYSNLLESQAYHYDNDLNFWTNIRPKLEEIFCPKLSRCSQILGRSSLPGASNDAGSNLVRAIRMCGATRIIVDAIVTGTLKSVHISVIDTRKLKERARKANIVGAEMAHAPVETVSDIVQVIEMICLSRSPISLSPKKHHANELKGEFGSARQRKLSFKHWKLTEVGMLNFIHKQTDPSGQQDGGSSG